MLVVLHVVYLALHGKILLIPKLGKQILEDDNLHSQVKGRSQRNEQ